MEASESRRFGGWLANGTRCGEWRRRYFWVAGGAILYDVARTIAWPTHASGAHPTKHLEFELRFQRGIVRRTLSLRAAEASADFWRRSLLWLAKLADAPYNASLTIRSSSPNAGRGGGGGQQPAALLTALGSLEAGGPNAEQQNAQTLRELMLGSLREPTRRRPIVICVRRLR